MHYSLQMGDALHLPEKDMDTLRFGSILHDIGKIGIPENILNKEGRLTTEAFSMIKQHPNMGFRILNDLTFMRDSVKIVHEHHEWYNGDGYPNKKSAEKINLLARIICIADAFDAMTTQRPYRKTTLTQAEAIAELRDKSGTQFDPHLVEIFVSALQK